MTREELIAALETAPEGSRELDSEIALVVEPGELEWKQTRYTGEAYPAIRRTRSNYTGGYAFENVPNYTTSLDAALTLVPEGARIRELGQWWNIDRPGGWFCNITRWEFDDRMNTVERAYVYGFADDDRMPKTAPNAALAICIAALKARI